MHEIVMEITLLIMENHGKSWNCVFEFLWEPCIKNAFFCQYLADILFQCIVCVISLLLLISGDVHPNPGPNGSLDTSTSSSCSDIPGILFCPKGPLKYRAP